MEVAAKSGATYTRYADDISFSGATLPKRQEIEDALAAEGFAISENKYRVIKKGQAQFVTGLSVSDPRRPHVPKWMKRRLRQELYYCNKFGVADHFEKTKGRKRRGVNRIDGTVKYVSFVERGTRYDFTSKWKTLLLRDDVDATYHPNHNTPTKHYTVVIDEALVRREGHEFMALGCAFFQESEKISELIRGTLDEYFGDPFAPGDRSKIEKEGLHYSATHPELRAKFVSRLAAAPFRFYVMFTRLPSGDVYSEAYLAILRVMMWHVLLRLDRQELTVLVEQNSRIGKKEVGEAVTDAYSVLTSAGSRRPLKDPTVEVVSKVQELVAIPDFMLGVFGSFVTAPREAGSAGRLQFERLRDRFSLIFDLNRNVRYSRRRPFFPEAMLSQTNASGAGPAEGDAT